MANVKVPPHNEEAEISVLGAVLIDPEAINTASAVLKSSDFYNPTHGTIFEAMLSLYEERKPIDLVTLTSILKKRKKYSEVGPGYLSQLINEVPTAANVEHYARLIKESATKRSLIHMSSVVSTLCFDD